MTTSPERLVRVTGLVGAAVLTACASALAWAGTAAADQGRYELAAQAIAVQSHPTDPGFVAGTSPTIGAYGASSHLNSNGVSASDAGAPYSPFVYSLPNFGSGVLFSSIGAESPTLPPSFPGFVTATDPITPAATQNAGGYRLTATAVPSAATGQVQIGYQAATSKQNNFFADARSIAGDNGLSTVATAGVHVFTLEGIADITNVASYASLDGDGASGFAPVTTTNLGTISLANLPTGLNREGFNTFGAEPTPIDTSNLDSLNAALKPAGVELAYLPVTYTYADRSTSSGDEPEAGKEIVEITSGALRIFLTNTSERGTSTETITIGQVHVAAGNATTKASGNANGSAPVAPVAADPAVPPPAPVREVGDSADPVPVAVLPTGSVEARAVPEAVTAAAPDAPLPTQRFLPAVAQGAEIQPGPSCESLYLFLAAGALVALLGGAFVGVAAVRG